MSTKTMKENRGNFYYLDVYRSGLIKDYRLS